MVPDLISTLIAIVLVCAAVLDRPALDSQPRRLLVIAGIALAILGTIANRVDYLKWPRGTVAAAGLAMVMLIVSGISSASSEASFWIIFWCSNIAGLMSLWSAFYRGPHASAATNEV